jgi:Rha family phage regulatory protein
MKTQNTYINAADTQTANAVIMANQNPFVYQFPGTSVDYSGIKTAPITMSSLEISTLTGKDHANVMRDIRNMLEDLNVGALSFEASYVSEQNKTLPCFNLPRREVDILLTGYSTTMRAAVIDRWYELEAEKNRGAPAKPSSLTGALNLACILAYKVEALEKQAAEDVEKVEFYNEFYEREELLNPTKASKLFGTGRNRYLQYLRDHKIIMSRPHQKNMPYQRYLDAGYFEVKFGTYENLKTGEREHTALPLLTGKGLVWLQKFIDEHGRDSL